MGLLGGRLVPAIPARREGHTGREQGERAWLGNRSIVLKGVTIGHDAVVAAGTVVTKDVPPRTLAAGVPARVIREF